MYAAVELSDSNIVFVRVRGINLKEGNEEDIAEEDSGFSEAAGRVKGFRGVFFPFFLFNSSGRLQTIY